MVDLRTQPYRPPPKNQEPPPPTEHEVELPNGHELADWLTNNSDSDIIVKAGQNSEVVGGVIFSCPSDGEDCTVKIKREGDSITATSTGGMARTTLEPRDPPNNPQPNRSPISHPTTQQLSSLTALRRPDADGNPRKGGYFYFTWLHGLQAAELPVAEDSGEPKVLSDGKSSTFSIEDGEPKKYGRVRFSCTGQDCEVKVHRRSAHDFIIQYKGNVKATLLPFDPEEMKGSWIKDRYCLNDSLGNCTFPDLVLNNPRILSSYSRYKPDSMEPPIYRKEILYTSGQIPTILTEDSKTLVADNHGWQGKRYVNHSDGTSTFRNNRIELIIYSNADGPEDTDYLSYSRSMHIKPNGGWLLGRGYEKSSGSTYGLGKLTGKVTYRGGATGWYALTGDLADENGEKADAGYFTARATFNADLNSNLNSDANLLIEGTIDKFVDQNGVERDWKIDLKPNKFIDRRGGMINISSPRRTEWTIGDDTAAPRERWEGYAAEEGNSIHGEFHARHGTEGRLDGTFGAEAERTQ